MDGALTMDEFDVEVAGGRLRVCRWPGNGPIVLAAHGITANALSFAGLAGALDGRVQLVAPDLRGRARSNALPGPYGMASHANDLIAIADHLGVERVPLVGHSMGGFVVASTAALYPQRVSGILMVDGGLPLPVPAGVGIDQVLAAVIGPAMQRLSMTFESPETYVQFFRQHPALKDGWEPAIEAYVLRDFESGRSSCSLEAVRADATDTLLGESPLGEITVPARLMYAERGMLNEEPGLYEPSRIRKEIAAEKIPGVNHYSIMFDAAAVGRVADRIVELAA